MGNKQSFNKTTQCASQPNHQDSTSVDNHRELKKINWLTVNGEPIQIKKGQENNLNNIIENQSNPCNRNLIDSEKLRLIKKEAHIVIIGAGPVGLWISILFKLKKPDMNIILYERHTTYARANNIKLPKGEKFQVPSIPRIKEMLEKKFIPIQELESILKSEAEKLNVKIIYDKISSLNQISYETHESMNLLIAADGAHSTTRDLVFIEKPLVSNLFNLVQVVYKTKGKAKDMNYFKKYAVLKKVDLFVEDTQIDNQVNLRFFVSDETFDKLKQFTVKNPCLDYNQIQNDEFRNKVLFWMKARKHYIGEEKILKDSFKLTAFNLDCYRAPSFGKSNISEKEAFPECPLVLCGDSAFGVPFYRSLRNGWKSGSELVKLYLAAQGQKEKNNFFDDYESFMNNLYESEKSRARSKYAQVNLFSSFFRISSVVPWQIIFITDKKAKIISSQELDVVSEL